MHGAVTRRTLVALVLVILASVIADCRPVKAGGAAARKLVQQANARCPVGCASDGCVLDSTSGGYKCIRCKANLVVNDGGTCSCPAGRYAKTREDCSDCDKGSYCLGGKYEDVGTPGKIDCATDLTTIGKRSTSIKACVNVPGTFYSVDASGNPSATTCPLDTYGPGLRKQRACVPCPAGYITNGLAGQKQARACVVPEGYYVKGPGQIAPCAMGSWKSGYAAAGSCTACALGVTTAAEAAKSEAACKVVLPGYYAAVITDGTVKQTYKCPQKFYCVGGTPTAAFNPLKPSETANTTVYRCPDQTWTQKYGSTSPDQCMTPPGFKTTIGSSGNGTTEPCANGEYRGEWKAAIAATNCSACGEFIQSAPVEQVVEYAITPDATPSMVDVRSTVAACYINAGQGMYYSSVTGLYKAVNCDRDNYGVANTTTGLWMNPCRSCPVGMMANITVQACAVHFFTDGGNPWRGGYNSPDACVPLPGFGLSGGGALKCPVGYWNPIGSKTDCTQCPYGTVTPNNPDEQISLDNCGLAPGYGRYNGTVMQCPTGTYNDVRRSGTASECVSCPVGSTTSLTGGTGSGSCDLCAMGYGGTGGNDTSCSTPCGGTNGATFGPAMRRTGARCISCPENTVGFSFDYLGQMRLYTPAIVSRVQATSSADCLNEFVQIQDGAWWMGGAATLTPVANISTFEDCVASCSADANCQYLTYDYDAAGDKCFKKVVGTGSDVVAFKTMLAGDTAAAASLKRDSKHVTAKGLASGSYTFWFDNSTGIGHDTSVNGSTVSVPACLASCDDTTDCAGVVMAGLVNATSTPTTCNLIKGDGTVAVFKRSMTKAVVSRLTLADIMSSTPDNSGVQ